MRGAKPVFDSKLDFAYRLWIKNGCAEMTQQEIAEKLNCKAQAINRIERRAKLKIKKLLEKWV